MPYPVPLERLQPDYDQSSDVLYVTWGPHETTHGIEVRPGVVFRLTEDNMLEGMTVYDVTRYFAFDPEDELLPQAAALIATILAQHYSSGAR